MSTIILFIIALALPWVVHIAPPRTRGAALVGGLAVLLLWAIVIENPLTTWALWVGLALGIISIVLAGTTGILGRGGGRSARRPRPRRSRTRLDDAGNEPTGEL